jgi:DnaK suppressor protein
MAKVAAAPFRAELESQRDRLLAQLDECGQTIDISNWDSRDPADAGNTALAREQTDAIAARARQRLFDVLDAIVRIDRGTFGACVGCGKQIPKARLEAIPSARHCVPCAS